MNDRQFALAEYLDTVMIDKGQDHEEGSMNLLQFLWCFIKDYRAIVRLQNEAYDAQAYINQNDGDDGEKPPTGYKSGDTVVFKESGVTYNEE